MLYPMTKISDFQRTNSEFAKSEQKYPVKITGGVSWAKDHHSYVYNINSPHWPAKSCIVLVGLYLFVNLQLPWISSQLNFVGRNIVQRIDTNGSMLLHADSFVHPTPDTRGP
jgi:hypothetical protein